MNIRGIEFNNIFCEPGTFGYFGEKKPFFARRFINSGVFIPRTSTLMAYGEGVEYDDQISKLGAGVVLSKEDLSGPGLDFLFNQKKWQSFRAPFFVSVVSMEDSKDKRLFEMQSIANIILKNKKDFKTQFGVLVCFNAPIDNDYDLFIEEAIETLNIFAVLNIPIGVQVSLSFPPDVIEKICADKNCDVIFVRASMPWNDIPNDAQKVFFRTNTSPFAKEGGGFVFGKYVSVFALEWARQAKRYTSGKPLIMGGGILGVSNMQNLSKLGVNGFILDHATLLRFWNINKLRNFFKK